MNNKVWISTLCNLILVLGCLETASALQPWRLRPWLSLHPTPLRRSDELRNPEDVLEGIPEDERLLAIGSEEDSMGDYLPWDENRRSKKDQVLDYDDIHLGLPSGEETPYESITQRLKRVFLSRGWMAGGYKAPNKSPNRFVRRPQTLAPMQERFTQPRSGGSPGGARYAALVSDQPQQSPPFRRFHSIFTSGMWTPIGKRSQGNPSQSHEAYRRIIPRENVGKTPRCDLADDRSDGEATLIC